MMCTVYSYNSRCCLLISPQYTTILKILLFLGVRDPFLGSTMLNPLNPYEIYHDTSKDSKLCLARTWNAGAGGQCQESRPSDSVLCYKHQRPSCGWLRNPPVDRWFIHVYPMILDDFNHPVAQDFATIIWMTQRCWVNHCLVSQL